jgi:hypothetical protein
MRYAYPYISCNNANSSLSLKSCSDLLFSEPCLMGNSFRVNRVTRRVWLAEEELLTPLEHLSSPLVFSGIRFTLSLVFCVLLSLSFWPLCCLSFDLRILIISLVSSNSSLITCYIKFAQRPAYIMFIYDTLYMNIISCNWWYVGWVKNCCLTSS